MSDSNSSQQSSSPKIMEHFQASVDGDRLCCKLCPKSYPTKTTQSSYSSLWYHLTKHGIVRPVATPAQAPPAKRTKIQQMLFPKKSQSRVYAELAAKDRFSFNQISSSKFIRSAMQQKFNVAHTSHTTIRAKVKDFWIEAKKETLLELKKKKEDGERFALTFDEWTGGNKRYLTVNVHFSGAGFINLGMIRVWSSQNAETLLGLVTKRMLEYELTWDDIVAITTDGASIMLKLGRLAPCDHIVCLSHTLHLVVGDILYEKKKKKKKNTDVEESDNAAISDDDLDESDEIAEQPEDDNDEDQEEELEDEPTDSDACLPSLSGIS